MELRHIQLGLRWLTYTTIGIMRFLFAHPRAIRPTFKFILSNVHALPRHLHYKTHIEEEQARIKGELARCSDYFKKIEAYQKSIDIEWLKRNPLPDIYRWARLYILIRTLRPKTVIETGVAEGESTSFILQALADNGDGFLYSIDLPNQFYITTKGKFHAEFNSPGEQPGCLVPPELRGRWKLILGNTFDTLPKLLTKLNSIDLFQHDSEHTYETMTFEYESAWPYICPGGYLVSDDATWNTSLSDFAQRHNVNLTIIEGQGFIQKTK